MDILVGFVHHYSHMMLPIESVEVHVKLIKFGILLFVPADAFLDSTWLEESALNVIQRPKSTIKKHNAATVSKDTTKCQDKDAMECVHPSAVPIKISLEEDVSVNLDIS